MPGPIQTYYAPNTKQIRYRNPSEKGGFLEKGEIIARFSLVPETKSQDCKAINVFGSPQTVNNRQGFSIESQQRQDDLKITRYFPKRELQLDKNPILAKDKRLKDRILDLCFKHKYLWSGRENGAYGKCNLFKFKV